MTVIRSIRVLYMPPVYAVISFFSYRYFRDYTYYELIETGASCLYLWSSAPDFSSIRIGYPQRLSVSYPADLAKGEAR